MAEERSFLSENGVYVSNTRVVIYGTTYATANITSVRKHVVPPQRGCALILAIFSALGLLGTLPLIAGDIGEARWVPFVFCLALLVVAIVWFQSLHPTYHVMLATAGGERSGLTSKDEAIADRLTAAIADAIVHRG